jgi:hypothetical protein
MIRHPHESRAEDLAFTRSSRQLELFATISIALLSGCFVLLMTLIF